MAETQAQTIATILQTLAGIYLSGGLMFAIAFVTRGVGTVDAAARGASWGFRLLILPGVAALWPVMLTRWGRAKPGAAGERQS